MADMGAEQPILTQEDLVNYIAAGEKPVADWRIGTEHEKFCFHKRDLNPIPYRGDPERGAPGIEQFLQELGTQSGWTAIMEGEYIIGLKQPNCPLGGSVTLEPGGQVELSGATLKNIHETCGEIQNHLRDVREIGDRLDIGFLGLGFSPKRTLADTPLMPKGRYDIMRAYMPKKGALGLDMMHRSCTVQVNLDFSDEADMVKKFRTSLALQPIATALFANSPFKEGKPNGYLSYRSALWLDTDKDRTGMLPFVFDDNMGYERYVDYALDVPMYFLAREGRYLDVSGQSFRDFMNGTLAGHPGLRPTIKDWEDHLTTLFPEVRLKRFLEMRGADGCHWQGLCALPALWVGLLYDEAALDEAYGLIADWSAQERQALREDVPGQGFKAKIRDKTVHDIAREVVAISASGLKRRAQLDTFGSDESHFLDMLQQILERGTTSAEHLLDMYHSKWDKDIDRLFAEIAY